MKATIPSGGRRRSAADGPSDRLQREGYVIECASDGESAFEKATSVHFDLMILDIMLPGRSGLDLCRDIRISGTQAGILLLTARGETVDKVVGLKLGADDYVTKPFDMMELTARIEALRDGVPLGLSARELQLLFYFVEHLADA
jgi:two-component system alkaline phosphatase synthesis response regulator PhoP